MAAPFVGPAGGGPRAGQTGAVEAGVAPSLAVADPTVAAPLGGSGIISLAADEAIDRRRGADRLTVMVRSPNIRPWARPPPSTSVNRPPSASNSSPSW